MNIVFDTNILIDIQKKNTNILNKLKGLAAKYPSNPHITFVNYYEFLFGINKKTSRKKESLEFIRTFPVLNTTKRTAEILAKLKNKYNKKGFELPLADFLIASLVIENNMILLTSDKDFEHFKELNKIVL